MSDADPKPWISATGYRTTVQAAHPTHGLSEYRPRCMVHGMPDCSPLLNGCSEAIRQYPAPVPAAPNERWPADYVDEFTPTDAEAREAFIAGSDEDDSGRDFDRWLYLRDCKVRDAALTEAADVIKFIPIIDWTSYRRRALAAIRSLQEGNK